MRNKFSLVLGLLLTASTCIFADGPATEPGIPLVPTTRPDGSTDYVAILNNECSRGVTPANNAGILLLPLFGTKDYPPEAFPILKSLGFEKLDSPPLEYFDSYMRRNLARNVDEADNVFEDRIFAMDKQTEAPWKAPEAPVIAAWFNENQASLRAAVQASGKSHYYIPLFEDHPGEGLLSTFKAMPLGKAVVLQHSLIKQAMLDYGQGDPKDGLEYLLAVHRLARLMAQQPNLLAQLTAAAGDRYASAAERRLVGKNDIGPESQQLLFSALAALPAFKINPQTFFGELQFNLEEMQMLRQGDADEALRLIGGFATKESFDHGYLATCDWTRMEKTAREDAARWDVATQAPDYSKRQAVIAEILKDSPAADSPKSGLEAMGIAPVTEKTAIETFLKKRSGEKGSDVTDRIGKWIFLSDGKFLARALSLIDENQVQACLTRTALALSLYKSSQGHYPDALDALTPQYLPSVPQDWFSGKPLVYRRTDETYILYSVGRNGIDDGGKDQNGDDGDIVVRSP